MKKHVGLLMAGLIVVMCAIGLTKENAENAQVRLMEGNARFVSDQPADKDVGETRRKELTKGQHPFATVITCSDSRVVPEYLFDQGLGDLFIIRVAGNVVDDVSLGSIEYGVGHLHTPMLVILGHQSCGAVTAALHHHEGEDHGEEGSIAAILAKIKPAVDKARAAKAGSEAETLRIAIHENVRNTKREILEKSAIVRKAVEAGDLTILLAEYQLDTGQVVILEDEEDF